MDIFFAWLEDSALSLYVREAPSIAFGFPGILVLHTLGMGFLAGIAIAFSLRILGAARGVNVSLFERFLPLFAFALAVNVVSGVLLLVGYPTKALTNPVFFLKLGFVAVGLVVLEQLRRDVFGKKLGFEPFSRRVQVLAVASIVCWVGAITSGRLLAYTYTYLLAGHQPRI